MRIILKGADVYSPPTEDHPDGGILYRAGRRIRWRLRGGNDLSETEKRNILIGEVGEAAVMADWKSRGYDINFVSWQEFNDKNMNETATDFIATKGQSHQRVQVKASEAGNRAINQYNMMNYERSKINAIVFVAVMELDDLDGNRYFECEITSQLSPRHIREMSCWIRRGLIYSHVDNQNFIKQWGSHSARRGAKQILSPADVWDLTS